MKALVCHGPRANAWPEMPGQTPAADAIVRADETTGGSGSARDSAGRASSPRSTDGAGSFRASRHTTGPSRPLGERYGEHHVDR